VTPPPVTLPPGQPAVVSAAQAPAPPPNAVVLVERKAADWLSAAGVPAKVVTETQLPAALDGATLVVLPAQEIRRTDTVDALKAYTARGGRILATYWGPPGIKTAVAAPLSSLLSVNVTGWSGKGNNYIAGVGAGKPLFNGTGRLYLGRGYTVVATFIPPSQSGATTRGPQAGKPPAQPVAPSAPLPIAPSLPPFVAGRWVKQDGRPLRDKDTAVVQTAATIWIAENIFASGNDSPEVRRWFANAATTVAPALRLPAKQALLTGAQSRLDAARAAVTAARAQGVDAPFNEAQTSLDAATTALADAGKAMDLTGVQKALDIFDHALADASAQSTPSRTVEARAVWIEQSALTKSRDDIRRLVGRLADARFNVILPEVVYRGRTAYPGSVYQQDSRFAGFDPLRSLIDEAHKRGMEVHPWVWTLCVGYSGEQGPILRSNPEWAARDKAGRTMTDGNRSFWLSPAVPAARTVMRNVIRELAARYDIDGIHLDYLRYNSPWFDYSDDARAAYKAATGEDPSGISSVSPAYVKWHLWREEQVNTLVREIHSDLASVRPGTKLSAAVYQTPDDARRDRLQDWAFWLKNRWLDWVAPMTYTLDASELSRWLTADEAAAKDSAHLVPGLDAGAASDPLALSAQIAAARSVPAQGIAIFSASGLTDDQLRSLRIGAFRSAAMTPWKDPGRAATALATASAQMFGAQAAPDDATATAARNAASAITAWSAGTAGQKAAASPPEARDKALSDARYSPARNLLEDARRIVAASLLLAPEAGLKPSPPPITTVANPNPLPAVYVPMTTAMITVDGKLDEPAWQSAATADLTHTSDGPRAKVGAVVKLLRDATTLYIGFTCPEPNMAALTAGVTDRDGAVYNDDSVEVFLAPNAVGLPYYHFVVGAGGGTWDDRTGDRAWNARWTSMVTRDASAWTVEIAIPFSSLNASPAGPWRANFARNRRPDGPSFITWSTPYGSYHNPDRFGNLTF
jgi:uncharacterized lipoprotein YddW (UPF0748 family)